MPTATMTASSNRPDLPFGEVAPLLLETGWLPMPIPAGQKEPPPPNLTGDSNPNAVKAAKSTKAWRKAISGYLSDEDFADWNTGIRIPSGIFVLDVDEYEKPNGVTKQGWQNLIAFADEHGLDHPNESLPKTVRITSRGYRNPSGHRLYRLPSDLDQQDEVLKLFPQAICPDVDVLRPGHRYTMNGGSSHPDGLVYQAFDERSRRPGRPLTNGLADVDPHELPEIPEEWLHAILAASEAKSTTTGDSADSGLVAPVTDEERSAAQAALAEWMGEQDTSSFANEQDVLARLTPSAKQRVLSFGDPRRNNANLPTAGIALLATLMEDVEADRRKGGPGVPVEAAISVARGLYIRGGDIAKRPKEFDRGLAWAFPVALNEVRNHRNATTLAAAHQVVEDQFWEQTEALRSCRDFARARQVAPQAMLAAALVIVASWLPPHLVLPPLVGDVASLNFYVALAAASGGGKSAATSAAKAWLNVIPHEDATIETDTPQVTTISSGEGLLQEYTVTVPKPKSEGARPGQKDHIQVRRSVRFEIDEIGALAAANDRQGSTLKHFLKTMWTGGGITTSAAETARVRKVEDHSFRATIVAGVQPALADAILSDHGGGFPQRWLWIDTYDEAALSDEELDALDDDPPPSYTWHVPRAAHRLPPPPGDDHDADNKKIVHALLKPTGGAGRERNEPFEILEVTKSIRQKVRDARRGGRKLGATDISMDEVLDGHKVLLEEKLAALLAALHGHIGITEKYERMAEWLGARSDETRSAIFAERTEEDRKAMEARARGMGRSDAIAQEVLERERQERAIEQVVQTVRDSDGGVKLSLLRRGLGLSRFGSPEEQVDFLESIPGIVVDGDVVTLRGQEENDHDR